MKAIIFDLFETLITEWGHEKYTKRMMAADLGVDNELFNNEWELLHRAMYMGEYLDFQTAITFVLNRINTSVETNVLNNVTEKRISTKAKCFENIDVRITDMLALLKKKGYKLGLISNCSLDEVTAFRSCEIGYYFDVILLSCEVGMAKPDKEIYERCAEKMDVAPGDCLFIGDGGSNELDGATEADMQVVQATWFVKCFGYNYENVKGYEIIDNPELIINYLGR